MLAVAALLSSCHGIYNDLEPCSQGVRLRFVYDYNMEYANAFHSQVDCLVLLVYDEQGNYLVTYIGTGDELKDENYRMTLDLEKGSYHFIAYGGLTCPKTSFSFKAVPGIGSIMQDLRVEMHNAGRVSETDLHPLFHGLAGHECGQWRLRGSDCVPDEEHQQHPCGASADERRRGGRQELYFPYYG